MKMMKIRQIQLDLIGLIGDVLTLLVLVGMWGWARSSGYTPVKHSSIVYIANIIIYNVWF